MNPPPSLLHVSLEDFFTFEVLKLAVVPLLVTMIVLYLLFFSTADVLLTQIHQIELEAQNPSGGEEGLLAWALRYSLTSWLAGILLYTVGIVAVMYLSIFTTLLIVGFMTPWLVEIVRRRHYPQEQTHGFGSVGSVLWHFIVTFGVMILLFLLLLPLYFIPLLGLLVIHLPFYYLFHRLLNYDVASTICSKEEFALRMRTQGATIRVHTLWMYLTTLIPFGALFAMLFYVLFLAHFYFRARLQPTALIEAAA
ncbi:MAG: EI24 domain-containing protein [Campylobacterales bacterium]|nr:EI24 domain-containing protein [Campylobacterales bacterium]